MTEQEKKPSYSELEAELSRLREIVDSLTGPENVFLVRPATQVRQTEKELRDKNREISDVLSRLSFHINNTPLAVLEWDPDFRLKSFSGAAERIFGWKADEVIGKTPLEIGYIHEEDLARVHEVLGDLLQGNRPRTVNRNRNYRKDGSVIFCEWYESASFDDQGRLVSFFSMAQDVTARVRAEEDLDRFFHYSHDLMCILENQRIERINPAFEKVLGYSDTEMKGRLIVDFIHPEDLPKTWFGRPTVLREGETQRQKLRFQRSDGQYVWLEWSSAFNRADNQTYGVGRDLTEQLKAESDQAWPAAIVDSSHDAIISLDRRGLIQTWNEGADQVFGLSADQAVGRKLLETIDLTEEPVREEVIRALEGNARLDNRETACRGANGRSLFISLSISPVRNSDDRILGNSIIIRDITEQTGAEEAFRQEVVARAAAEEASRMKDQFLSFMSHELRTPLSGIIGFAQTSQRLAARNKLTPEKLKIFLENIVSSGRRLADIIEDVLDVAKIEADRLDIRLEPVNLIQVLDNLSSNLSHQAEEKGLELEIDISPDLPPVQADPKRLNQILYNLVGNAVKFTPKGRVVVKSEVAEDQPEFVLTSIRDTGVGIPAADVKRVFDRFTRLESSGSLPGTGLGLTISSKLVDLLGGEIRVESEEGKGSVFSFTLPIWAE